MDEEGNLLALGTILVPLSLAAIGGAASIYAPLQHQVVDVRGWLSPRDYLDLFAVSRIMPGPGSFLATLIGWRVAGWLGAIVATLAIFLPSSALCLAVSVVWKRSLSENWRRVLEEGLSPIGAGLMFAGVVSVMSLSRSGLFAWVLLLASAAIMTLKPRLNPLWLMAAGGLISLAWMKL